MNTDLQEWAEQMRSDAIATYRAGLRERVAIHRTPQPRFDDGRPNPNGYEGGWHDAIEEVIGILEVES